MGSEKSFLGDESCQPGRVDARMAAAARMQHGAIQEVGQAGQETLIAVLRRFRQRERPVLAGESDGGATLGQCCAAERAVCVTKT